SSSRCLIPGGVPTILTWPSATGKPSKSLEAFISHCGRIAKRGARDSSGLGVNLHLFLSNGNEMLRKLEVYASVLRGVCFPSERKKLVLRPFNERCFPFGPRLQSPSVQIGSRK